MKEKIRTIADHYGLSNQLMKTVEELNELSIECAKSWGKKEIRDNLISEVADVLVMITQIIYLGKIEWKEVEDVMKYKVDRQIQRIKEEENED
mgnify:CR=1 FL=1